MKVLINKIIDKIRPKEETERSIDENGIEIKRTTRKVLRTTYVTETHWIRGRGYPLETYYYRIDRKGNKSEPYTFGQDFKQG